MNENMLVMVRARGVKDVEEKARWMERNVFEEGAVGWKEKKYEAVEQIGNGE